MVDPTPPGTDKLRFINSFSWEITMFTNKLHVFNSGHSEDLPGTEVLHEERQMSGGHGSSDSSQWRLFIQYTESHTEALSTEWGGKGEQNGI